MKPRKIFGAAAAFSVMTLGMATSAQAHRIVHVEGTLYVIICDNNGGNFTFSGSQSGAGEVAGMICPTAMVGGGTGTGTTSANTFEKATPASVALKTKPKGTVSQACPKGTHWYEPAKACVANGGHPN
jgi:hypothetical protein